MNRVKNIINWLLGITLCSLGVALCTKAGFGLSMIGAPPYIIHVWLRDYFAWFTQGTGENVWEALILIITIIIIRRFKVRYLFSFAVAVILGLMIDLWLFIMGGNQVVAGIWLRIVLFALGTVITSIAVAFYFRTDLPLQVYELSVVEISDRFGFKQENVKWVTDITYLVIAIVLSLTLTRKFTGVGIGTVIITVVNAPLITFMGRIIDKVEK